MYNRKIYDIASKYHHRLLNLDEALALCRGREEEFFSALQDIGELSNNIKQYYIMKTISNNTYAVESLRINLENILKQIHQQIQMGDKKDITDKEASLINKIFDNRTLRVYMKVAQLSEELPTGTGKVKVMNMRDAWNAMPTADEIKEPETPTIDRCVDLYYEYLNNGDTEKANAMLNIITYKGN